MIREVTLGTKDSVEGVVYCMRSEPKDPPCGCCGGMPHFYGVGVKIEPQKSNYYTAFTNKSIEDFLHEFVAIRKNEIEGKRVRVTIEVLED
jgi:hypothetical protein